MKVLIIRFSSIGDIVLTTPVVRCLKAQLPHCEIHYLTKEANKGMIESHPKVEQGHYLGKAGLAPILETLVGENFDHVIDLHHNLRSMMVKKKLGKPSASFKKLNIQKWLLTNLKIDMMPDLHIVDRYMAAVASLGVTNDGQGLDYFVDKEDSVELSSLPLTHQNGFIGFAIGAKFATKKLPAERIIELCKLLNEPIVLMGDGGDTAVAEAVEKEVGDQIYNACGKYRLNQTASLVEQSSKMITHDTGLMHIAAAFNKPIASVWGNTVPKFGMSPYSKNKELNMIAEVNGLSCRPCSKIGHAKCPKGHFKCMEKQDLSLVAAWANKKI